MGKCLSSWISFGCSLAHPQNGHKSQPLKNLRLHGKGCCWRTSRSCWASRCASDTMQVLGGRWCGRTCASRAIPNDTTGANSSVSVHDPSKYRVHDPSKNRFLSVLGLGLGLGAVTIGLSPNGSSPKRPRLVGWVSCVLTNCTVLITLKLPTLRGLGGVVSFAAVRLIDLT